MALDRLRLVHEAFELCLLELEVFLFERSLLRSLCLWFGLASWSGQDEALVHICDVVIVQVLCVVFLKMRPWLLVWR